MARFICTSAGIAEVLRKSVKDYEVVEVEHYDPLDRLLEGDILVAGGCEEIFEQPRLTTKESINMQKELQDATVSDTIPDGVPSFCGDAESGVYYRTPAHVKRKRLRQGIPARLFRGKKSKKGRK